METLWLNLLFLISRDSILRQPFVSFAEGRQRLPALLGRESRQTKRLRLGKEFFMKYSGIGGQAVIEGIMMKNKSDYATAVRKPDGQIEVKKDQYVSMTEKVKL